MQAPICVALYGPCIRFLFLAKAMAAGGSAWWTPSTIPMHPPVTSVEISASLIILVCEEQAKTRSQGMSKMEGGSLNRAEVEAMMYLPTRAPRCSLIFVTVLSLAKSKPVKGVEKKELQKDRKE